MIPTDHVYLKTSNVKIGTFRCSPHHPHFHDSGPISGYLIVFPRTSVTITHIGKSSVVTDPNVVMFYNKGQEYFRDKVSEEGDLCDWFSFPFETVQQAIKLFVPDVETFEKRPFRFTHGPGDPTLYFQQRLLIQQIRQADKLDMFYFEEQVLMLLKQVLERSYLVRYGHKVSCKQPTLADRRDLVEQVKSILVTRFHEPLSINQIAQEVHSSPYHLCRIFRQITGLTIHNYLNRIRLHHSLDYLSQSNHSISEMSYELGFSSHSHFTAAFRRIFTLSPSEFRKRANSTHLSNILIV